MTKLRGKELIVEGYEEYLKRFEAKYRSAEFRPRIKPTEDDWEFIGTVRDRHSAHYIQECLRYFLVRLSFLPLNMNKSPKDLVDYVLK